MLRSSWVPTWREGCSPTGFPKSPAEPMGRRTQDEFFQVYFSLKHTNTLNIVVVCKPLWLELKEQRMLAFFNIEIRKANFIHSFIAIRKGKCFIFLICE